MRIPTLLQRQTKHPFPQYPPRNSKLHVRKAALQISLGIIAGGSGDDIPVAMEVFPELVVLLG